MPEWLPSTDDVRRDGAVEVCAVQADDGRAGLRVRLLGDDPSERAAFEAFYDGLSTARQVHLVDRGPGWVVFESAEDLPADMKRFAVEAVDAIEAVRGALLGLSADEIGCREGRVHLQPRWRNTAGPPPLRGLGDYLRRQDARGLDDALDSLVDASPEVRGEARSKLVGQPSDAGSNALVKVTVAAPERQSRGQLDTVRPRAAVVVPPEALASLSPAQRSAAAGLAGLSLNALDGLQVAGLPLVLETHRRPADAARRSLHLSRETGLPLDAAVGGGVMRPLFALALFATSVGTAMGALSFAMLGLFTVPLLGAALTAAMTALGSWMLWAWQADRSLLAAATHAYGEAEEERARLERDPDLARAWSALADARASLAAAEGLPRAAAADLREVLRAAERELEALGKAREVVRKGLAAGDPESVRARLEGLDPDDPNLDRRRESLERTLQELEERMASGARILEDAHELEAVLSEVATAVTRWETGSEEQGMQAVLRATGAARARRSRVVT